MEKLNTAYVRKIVKDNGLDIQVRGRTNGVINIYPMNYNDLTTIQELLKGMGYRTLLDSYTKWYTIYKN